MPANDPEFVFEEEHDADYDPSEKEINEYGTFLGMDVVNDKNLMWIAKESLKAPLPPNWKPCKTAEGSLYYFNFSTGTSKWTHPCDDYYKKLYIQEKEKISNNITENDKRRKSVGFQNKESLLPVAPSTEFKNLFVNDSKNGRHDQKLSASLNTYLTSSAPSTSKSDDQKNSSTLEDNLLMHSSSRKSFLDPSPPTKTSLPFEGKFESRSELQMKKENQFLTLNTQPTDSHNSKFHNDYKSAYHTVSESRQSEKSPFIQEDTWYAQNNIRPPSHHSSNDHDLKISEKYTPTSSRRDSQPIKIASPFRSGSIQHSSNTPIENGDSAFLRSRKTAEPSGHYEKQLMSCESLETDAFEKEAKKIREKYSILLDSFEKDKYRDFLFNVEEKVSTVASKNISEINDSYESKIQKYKVGKDSEYRTLTGDVIQMWKDRLDSFESEQKRNFDKNCRDLVDEYEHKLEIDMKKRKEAAKKEYELELERNEEKYEDLNAREKKRKHYEGLKYMEDLDDNLKLDLRKMKEDTAKRLVIAEEEYNQKIIALNEKKVDAEKNFEKDVEQRYLTIEKDKLEAFTLQSQSTKEKELALKVKKEKLRIEEDDIRKLEFEVKGFRNTILIEKRNMVDHEYHQQVSQAPRSPEMTLNDLTFSKKARDTSDDEADVESESEGALDIDDLKSNSKSRSTFKKSVHMQKLNKEFEKEENQIKAAKNLLEVQGQSFSVKQKELDQMQSKWTTDMTDIQTLLDAEVCSMRQSRSPSLRATSPSKFPIPSEFKSNDQQSAYAYQDVLMTKNGDSIQTSNPTNDGINHIIDLLTAKNQIQTHEESERNASSNSRYKWFPRHVDTYIPEPVSQRKPHARYNRFIDSSKLRSESLLREHHQWLRSFTARHSDLTR